MQPYKISLTDILAEVAKTHAKVTQPNLAAWLKENNPALDMGTTPEDMNRAGVFAAKVLARQDQGKPEEAQQALDEALTYPPFPPPADKRPTDHHPRVLQAACDALLPAVFDWLQVPPPGDAPLNREQREARTQLLNALHNSFGLDGYELSRTLERDDMWDPDANLVDILDNAWSHVYQARKAACEAWVAHHKITPALKEGDEVEYVHGEFGDAWRPGYVTKIDVAAGEYTIGDRPGPVVYDNYKIDPETKRPVLAEKGGVYYIVPYEEVRARGTPGSVGGSAGPVAVPADPVPGPDAAAEGGAGAPRGA